MYYYYHRLRRSEPIQDAQGPLTRRLETRGVIHTLLQIDGTRYRARHTRRCSFDRVFSAVLLSIDSACRRLLIPRVAFITKEGKLDATTIFTTLTFVQLKLAKSCLNKFARLHKCASRTAVALSSPTVNTTPWNNSHFYTRKCKKQYGKQCYTERFEAMFFLLDSIFICHSIVNRRHRVIVSDRKVVTLFVIFTSLTTRPYTMEENSFFSNFQKINSPVRTPDAFSSPSGKNIAILLLLTTRD